MRILTQLPQDDLLAVPATARAAETAGFNGLTTSENKNDPFLALAVAAVSTQHASLQTSIAIAFSRSPMAVANASWDLQTASRGRFVLGLGSQVRAHNENRFSVPWTAPAPRMREYVLALRAIWRNWEKGEKLDFRGTHYKFTLMTPNFTPTSTHQPPIPVTIAAVGPVMVRVAGEVCDGVRLMLSTPEPGFDHPGSVVYFAVDDIRLTHEALKSRGVTFRAEPHKIATLADREVWLAEFEDTEGNTLALMSEPRI